ncbi:MAG: hypothetical protein AMXMBFR84_42840 [Candidatus Hydrogenedentota bacterium]
MTRKRPEDRLQKLVETATEVFIVAQSYQRTQMDDVAKALGVSKGTVYLYVASKEALFDLCVRHADAPEALTDSTIELPHRSADSGATLEFVQAQLAGDKALGEMLTLLSEEKCSDAGQTLESIVRLLYRTLLAHRRSIKLVEAAAQDHPGLSDVWYPNARGQLLQVLLPFVERNIQSGAFRRVRSPAMAARHLIETCTFWAIHRYWDPAPQDVDPGSMEDGLVELLLPAFMEHA